MLYLRGRQSEKNDQNRTNFFCLNWWRYTYHACKFHEYSLNRTGYTSLNVTEGHSTVLTSYACWRQVEAGIMYGKNLILKAFSFLSVTGMGGKSSTAELQIVSAFKGISQLLYTFTRGATIQSNHYCMKYVLPTDGSFGNLTIPTF